MILGIDVSWWQGEVNWLTAEQAGAEFAFIRAGSANSVTGNPYTDFALATHLMDCHLPRGFYWYFRPNHTPVEQANYFADLLLGERNDLGLVCDIENSAGLLPGDLQNRIKTFLDTLEARGHSPIIYTRASFWNFAVGNPSWASQYPLWCARYTTFGDTPTMSGPWADGRFKPSSWDQWEYWQFSADGNGLGSRFGVESGSIDLNVKRVPLNEPPEEPIDITQELAAIRAAVDNIEVKVGL